MTKEFTVGHWGATRKTLRKASAILLLSGSLLACRNQDLMPADEIHCITSQMPKPAGPVE